MELSVFIPKITAVVYLSAALGAIFSKKYYQKLLDDLFGNAGLTYMTGFTAVIIGFLLVNYHNIWEMNWTVLITIIGWLALIKSVLIIAFPKFVYSYSQLIFKEARLRIFPFVAVLMGLIFGYFGFAAC